jgi:hypothetical protein
LLGESAGGGDFSASAPTTLGLASAIFSEAQWRILKQLVAASEVFSQYAGKPVRDLLASVFAYRAELDESGEEFAIRHYSASAIELPVRDVRYLARLYRQREYLELDEAVEAVFRQTWDEDAVRLEYDEHTMFRSA